MTNDIIIPSLIHAFTLVPTPNGWTIIGLSVHINSNKNAKMHDPAIHVADVQWQFSLSFRKNMSLKLYLNLLESNELIYKTETENELMVTRGEVGWGRLDWEFGIDMYTLLYLKQITNKDHVKKKKKKLQKSGCV